MFPKFSKQAFNRLAQSVGEMREFEKEFKIPKDEEYESGRNFPQKEEYLTKSIEMGNASGVQMAIEKGADVNKSDSIILAAENNQKEIVELLLEAGADFHVRQDLAFRKSAYLGYFDVAEVLLDAGSDINSNKGDCLTVSAKNGKTEVVEFLLSHGADSNINNYAPLRNAINSNRVDVVEALLSYGARIPPGYAVDTVENEDIRFLLEQYM